MTADPHRSDRIGRRAGIRVAVGSVLGPLVGGAIGLLFGAVAFDVGTRGMWGSVIAGVVFGALGGFWARMSALGPPAPQDDPLPREDGAGADLGPGETQVRR